MLDQLKKYVQNAADKAAQWVAANPHDTVYAAVIVAGLTLLSGGRRR